MTMDVYNDRMIDNAVSASDFKARCLALIDEVATTGHEIVVTKRGVPMARLVPIAAPEEMESTVSLAVDDDADYFSTGEVWDVDR